jgi:hypothetical protein
MKTGTLKKINSNTWVNDYTKYRIEYSEGYNSVFCYVVYDNENFVVWDFQDLKSAKICSKENYIDSVKNANDFNLLNELL